jgi:hypothetical protein
MARASPLDARERRMVGVRWHGLQPRAHGRRASGPLPAPNVGRFANGVGLFYADFTDNGKAIRSRLKWSDITPRSARWEQAYSYDGGKTWDTNWIMTFERRS